ncbi:glycosyltransferase [uncultured Duncaniella sp.]|uniref:glycosyltransferase n=1 Tax=uncultured Duncaniella sp. TaxID=2768039 RepID=UPI002677661B|nr:glycosyltransferase [uncultured Duncaniella sp.]
MFEISLTPTIISLLAVIVVSALYLLLGFRRYVAMVSKRVSHDTERDDSGDGAREYPSVSVIVYSEDDASNLEVLLPQILDQDYPAPFEVIVVNDGAIDSTKDVIARLEQKYSNLYMTFTPQESRSLSRKKLAVTLGIKAAKYNVLLHTTGVCQVPSRQWLKSMAGRFDGRTDVVLGYAAPAAQEGTSHPWKRLHAFDQVRSAVEWISWAIAGRPYRGTACNIAYRREVFFRNKGFSRSLDLKYGDDDVFVSEVATGDNTAVELSTDSMLLNVQAAPAPMHRAEKIRRDYTASRLRGHARLFFSTCSWAWWILLGSVVAVSIVGLPSILPMIVSVVVLLATWIWLMFTWRRTSRMLWSRSILITFPWFMSYHPIYTLYYRIKGMRKRGSNLTWG